MKLSKLYSNKPDIFIPIKFLPGLNVVMAEIRLPENKLKDTHNLGKTTLGRIIDFCLLSKKNNKFFLFKHINIFEEFVFFLEIELFDNSFISIRRSVREPSKISFKRHKQAFRDFNDLPSESWDHNDLPFDRAKDLLDGILDLRDLKPDSFRKIIGYLLRTQQDFQNVFKLENFSPKHVDWKPFLAHLLGFNAQIIKDHYNKDEELLQKQSEEKIIKKELCGSIEDIGDVEGIFLLKQNEANKKQNLLDEFNFHEFDIEKTKIIVDELDTRIALLNEERYSLSLNKKKIADSIADSEMFFDPQKASEIFSESGIVFAGQIRKDFEQLIAFNRAITEERYFYLKEELSEVEVNLQRVNNELTELHKRRIEILSFLKSSDIFDKYKQISKDLISLKSDLVSLDRQRESLHKIQEIRTNIRSLKEEKTQLQNKIEIDVTKRNSEIDSSFSVIRIIFNEIVESVIDRKALLSVSQNQEGHLEFKAEILDDSGNATSADLGHTYRKLLCIALDLALLRAHLGNHYPRFVFHDGVFESLDNRKKENLIEVIRVCTNLGIQIIITLIDSDLPARTNKSEPVFNESEIILHLHDENESGRLFKMSAW